MIQIIHGSIFDSKCDLLIVPCDSAGGVTQSVFTNLRENGLPTNVGRIPYGKVHFRESKYAFANTVGYAASVDVNTVSSDPVAIEKIGHEIVRYSVENQIRKVNIPLLGTGAGGMNPAETYEALHKAFSKKEDITFNVFCFTRDVYLNVSSSETSEPDPFVQHPRVFISYTGADKENAGWVKILATVLRNNGVDARLDMFHLKPGLDMPQWMTNEVIMADKVLLICDRHYMEKADFRKGGVGWETMIIQGDMLAQGDNKRKYIAIVREESPDKALPIYMKSKFAFSWGKSSEIDPMRLKELILCIFDCDTEPDLGAIPSYVKTKVTSRHRHEKEPIKKNQRP